MGDPNELNEEEDENEDKQGPPPPPLLHFSDIECFLTEERIFIPNLICWSSEEDDDVIHHCNNIEDFLQALGGRQETPQSHHLFSQYVWL